MKQKSPDNIAIGARIKEVRKQRDITQEKLAELINLCDGQRISEIERGVSSLSIAKFRELCKVLDVESDYLLFGTVSRDKHNPIAQYFSQMTPEQVRGAEQIIRVYAKACGIE